MSVEELVVKEPWRRGSGQPINALDPTWSIKRSIPCNGEIAFEVGTDWWWCKQCGFCGKQSLKYNSHFHVPVQDPMTFMLERIQQYVEKRVTEGVPREAALQQMMQIAGTAIGYGSTLKTEDLKDYLDQLRIR